MGSWPADKGRTGPKASIPFHIRWAQLDI
jgi:hypothetical protein